MYILLVVSVCCYRVYFAFALCQDTQTGHQGLAISVSCMSRAYDTDC